MIQEAYVLGVSTRRVDDLVRALGLEGISRSEVSRICAALDTEVAAFRGPSLAGEAYPYLWLDATYLKVREQGRVNRTENRGDSNPLKEDGVHDRHQATPKLSSLST